MDRETKRFLWIFGDLMLCVFTLGIWALVSKYFRRCPHCRARNSILAEAYGFAGEAMYTKAWCRDCGEEMAMDAAAYIVFPYELKRDAKIRAEAEAEVHRLAPAE